MSCSVAVANSPVFSPSRVISTSLFCNKASILSSSPDSLSLSLTHLKPSPPPSSSPSSSSPSSPFRLRLQKPPTGLSNSSFSSSTSNPVSISGSGASPTILKRKRPARLDIPVAALSFGVPATPATDTLAEEREEYGYSVYCKRGRREAMEDRYSASVAIHGDSKQALFGVFDGHGGAMAAEFAAENLNETETAVKHGYLKTDLDFLNKESRGGSCCVTALIRRGNLFVSNAGDCRAVVCRAGTAEALTSDHRPCREDEKERIEAEGGYVDIYHGVWRIQGSLAVSRGIGDRHFKKWVTAEPETNMLKIEAEHEFLILASDGLWEKVSNQEAVDIARPLCMGTDRPEPMLACRKLADLSASRGSYDDISVMLIQLGRYM
ncbi:probable protein phosphatase 2C 25 isoform X2 [Rhodamnia argentea]|uniref:protein-serine/threonine phosphatase n=1 Tax=Rhodamnia argentea TaxID=178133 RepID=A0ABM3HHB9_9MYRT|nr:probable protein phosphatase 2C 25 isoform X2 [Rhodamnia argentea]